LIADSGSTPEELEMLLEDAFVLRDVDALAGLFIARSLLIAGNWAHAARGREQITRIAPQLWAQERAYFAEPRRVVQSGDIALAVGDDAINVARRAEDGSWRYAIA
jgi:hypothetical protein